MTDRPMASDGDIAYQRARLNALRPYEREKLFGLGPHELEAILKRLAAAEKERDALRARITEMEKGQRGECIWTDQGEMWETSCGNAWCFNVDGPRENGVKFCPYCGNHLKQERSHD